MDGEFIESLDAVSEHRGFHALYQKTLPYPARRGLALWSPQLDLIALVTTNDTVLLYRMNGQRVWGISHKLGSDIQVERLQWRPDGKMLALGYSDGSTRIYDVNNGRQIHKLSSEASSFGSVTCVSWVDNHSHQINTNVSPETKTAECTPEALFDLDISSMLPRLSVLPSSSGPESSFTSKTTLDALINAVTKGGEGSHLDVLFIGDETGKVLLNVFDSFLIGTMELSKLSHQLKPQTRLLRHTASSNLATQALLLHEPGTNKLLFSTMDILFIQQFGQYLFQLASTSTRVQALLRYMTETITAMQTEFKTMNDLTKRFVNIIAEDADNAGSEVGLEFFEFLVTGLPSPVLKEWLLDVLQERGQKRWEKSSLSGYENLRRLAHEHLLPTCERLTVLFCRLRGLARWKEKGSPLGLEPDDFTRCLDVVSAITLFTHEFILTLNRELDLYSAFTGWLRHALDQLSTVINIDDKPVEDPAVDTLKVAEFVGEHLRQSGLEVFFGKGSTPALVEYKGRGESIQDLYSDSTKQPPGFSELVNFLDDLSRSVFSKPQQAMRQQLRLGKPLLMHVGDVKHQDIRIIDQDKGNSSAYVVLYPDENPSNSLFIVRCEVEINGGLSSLVSTSYAVLHFPSHARDLIDIHFVDDNLLILILRDAATMESDLMTIDYSPITTTYKTCQSSSNQSVLAFAKLAESQPMAVVSRRSFDSSWVPAQVTVNGKEGRRIGCVLADDAVRYLVCDLDHGEDDGVEIDHEEEDMEVDDDGESEGEEERV